jgi:hypothetical protein
MLRFQFSPCHTFKKKWKTHICWEFSAWPEFISQRVKIIFFEQIKLVNTYKTIVYYTMEYPALKTFATLPSTFTRNTPSLVDQPNRNPFYNIETNYWKSPFFFIKFLLPKINSDVHPLLFIEIWNQKIFFFKILIFLIINSLTVVFMSYSPVAYSLLFSLCCAWYKMFRTK